MAQVDIAGLADRQRLRPVGAQPALRHIHV
jgi:hypothetical protein